MVAYTSTRYDTVCGAAGYVAVCAVAASSSSACRIPFAASSPTRTPSSNQAQRVDDDALANDAVESAVLLPAIEF